MEKWLTSGAAAQKGKDRLEQPVTQKQKHKEALDESGISQKDASISMQRHCQGSLVQVEHENRP